MVILHVLQPQRTEHCCGGSQCFTIEVCSVSEAPRKWNFGDVRYPRLRYAG